ncbi:uncharacterized protein LOC131893450 [Tigriopus californicus]|uniref:uncharacterized protein LOC131893450 n=1 Tax=Tigriopus californicus TaxID=6832 RepID=UPI0027DA74CB|nr:uncharacterized protein LOC131893450 [Tigriopus californicus]
MISTRRIVYICLVLLVPGSMASPRIDFPEQRHDLVKLSPQESCYYQGYNKKLICVCNSTDTSAYLHLRMKYYEFSEGNEIQEVRIQQCKELLVRLDLRGVDATKAPIHFRQIRKVKIEKIMFEPRYSVSQELELVFDNVEELLFEDLFVEDTLKIRANNVKDAKFIRSTFAHIPPKGFQISRAKLLDIRDSTFLRVSKESIVVEKTTKVIVLMNEMTINALMVVTATDGSYLMISCNRLRGQPVSPECSKSTTTTTTTTSTLPPPPALLDNQENLRKGESIKSGDHDHEHSILPQLLGGVLGGIILILLIVIFFICFMKRKRRNPPETVTDNGTKPDVVEVEMDKDSGKPPTDSPEPPKESDSLLEPPVPVQEGDEDDDDEDKPRFSAPIWLDEIHKNKIFNRQKSLLSHEGLKELAEGTKAPVIPEEQEPLPVHTLPLKTSPQFTHSEDEMKESSRTESDEDFREKFTPETTLGTVKSPEGSRHVEQTLV